MFSASEGEAVFTVPENANALWFVVSGDDVQERQIKLGRIAERQHDALRAQVVNTIKLCPILDVPRSRSPLKSLCLQAYGTADGNDQCK